MSVDLLKSDISSRSFRKIYMITGDEAYLKRYYLRELKKAVFGSEGDSPDCITCEGESLTTTELSDALSAYPMVAEKKVIVIYDLKGSDAAAVWLCAHPDALDEGAVVIIYSATEKPDLRTTNGINLKKLVNDNGLWVEVNALDTQTLRRWVAQQFRKRNTQISGDSVIYLLSQTSNDMFSLQNEIDKLCSYCNGTATNADIDAIISKTVDAKTYDLTDAIFEKNRDKAYNVLKKLAEMRTAEIMIMAVIFTAVTSVYRTKMLADDGLTTAEIGAELGQKGFILDKNIRRANKLDYKTLDKMLDLCADADLTSKTTAVNSETLLAELTAALIAL